MSTSFLLFESASGFALFEVKASDELAQGVEAVQRSVESMERFGKSVKLAAFKPFTSAANALEQINAVSESQVGQPAGRQMGCERHACCCWRALGALGRALAGLWTSPESPTGGMQCRSPASATSAAAAAVSLGNDDEVAD